MSDLETTKEQNRELARRINEEARVNPNSPDSTDARQLQVAVSRVLLPALAVPLLLSAVIGASSSTALFQGKTPARAAPSAYYLAVSPKGDTIAYNDFNEGQGEDARSIIICDGKSGKLIKKLRTDGTLGLSFFPDGSTLISHYRDIDFWNTTTWKIQKTLKKNTDGMVAISPDMKRFAFATSPRRETILVLFSLEKDRPLAELRGGAWPEGVLRFNGPCRFSPNGKWLFAITFVQVRMWDGFSGKLKTDIETRSRSSLRSFAVSPDNQHLVVGGEWNCLQVWSLDPIKKRHDLKGHGPKMPIESVAFSPKGDMLLTGTSGLHDGGLSQWNEVKLWDTKNWREIGSLKHLGWAGCVNFLPNGEDFVTGRLKNDGSVEIFRVQDVIKKSHKGK